VHGANCTTSTFTEQANIFRTLIRQNSNPVPRFAARPARCTQIAWQLAKRRSPDIFLHLIMHIAVKEMGQNIFVVNTLQMPYLGA
jgi:hypothetical protein